MGVLWLFLLVIPRCFLSLFSCVGFCPFLIFFPTEDTPVVTCEPASSVLMLILMNILSHVAVRPQIS